jgi:hypothetical protein
VLLDRLRLDAVLAPQVPLLLDLELVDAHGVRRCSPAGTENQAPLQRADRGLKHTPSPFDVFHDAFPKDYSQLYD